jgi:mRNA interferase RelE/StbE
VNYRVVLSRRAESIFGRIDATLQKRLLARFEELGSNPLDPRISKPLTGQAGVRSSRIGAWRILFTIEQQIVEVLWIEPRGQVYKRL